MSTGMKMIKNEVMEQAGGVLDTAEASEVSNISEISKGTEYVIKGNTIFALKVVYTGEKTAQELVLKAVESLILEQSR